MAEIQLAWNRYGIQNEKFLGNNFSYPYFFVNPRIGLNENFSDNLNAYASAAYTSREPTLRNLYAAEDTYFGAAPQFRGDTTGGVVRYDFTQPLAQPEHLLDIEVGGSLKTVRAQLSASFFWMEFTDELVKSGQVDIFGQPVTGNAERTRHLGVEIEGSAGLSDAITIGGNAAISSNRLIRHTEYVPSTDATGAAVYAPVSLDGNPIAGFPDFLGNLRLSYRGGSIASSLTVKYVGSFYTDNFKNEANKNDDYIVVNGEILLDLLGFNSEFTLRGEVRNIFNRLYFAGGEGEKFFPAAERNYLFGIVARF